MGNKMLKYTIFFTDGGTLGHKGTIKIIDNVFHFYGEDKIVRLLIPVSQVKYIMVDQIVMMILDTKDNQIGGNK